MKNIFKMLVFIVCILTCILFWLIYHYFFDECYGKTYRYIEIGGKEYVLKSTPKIDSCLEKRFENPVVYNFSTHIYHDMDCEWSQQCVESCVFMEETKAEQLGRRCYECAKLEREAIEEYEKNYEPDDYTYEDRFGIEH